MKGKKASVKDEIHVKDEAHAVVILTRTGDEELEAYSEALSLGPEKLAETIRIYPNLIGIYQAFDRAGYNIERKKSIIDGIRKERASRRQKGEPL